MASINSNTYCYGDDAGQLAARARELGLEQRAALLRQQRDTHSLAAGILGSTTLRLALLSSFDPEYDDSEGIEPLETEARPGLRRVPSWLEESRERRRGAETERTRALDGFGLVDAFLAVIKSAVGPAVLYMPKGFQEGGLAFSLGMLCVSYGLFGLGAMRLLGSWQKCRKSYPAMMGRAFGHRGVLLVRFTIVAQQCGICLTYFIFVATNLRELWIYFAGPLTSPPALGYFCVGQLAVLVPLSCIRNMQNFALTNLVANVLILYAIVVLAAFATVSVAKAPPAPSSLPLFNPKAFYLFIGTSAFVYEGSAALVVPLQEAVRPDLQREFPRLYLRTCGGIIVTYIFFGALNWAAYGAATETVLTVNLPSGAWKASVQLAYSAAVIFTFPLQLFPAIQILKSVGRKVKRLRANRGAGAYASLGDAAAPAPGPPSLSAVPELESSPETPPAARADAKPPRPRTSKLEGNLARFALVAVLCAISVAEVNSLDKLVALIGGCLGIPLAFIFPLLIHLKLVDDASPATRAVNRVAAVLGLALCLTCSAVTVATW